MMEDNVLDATIDAVIFYRKTRGLGDACMLKPTVDSWQKEMPNAEIVVVMDSPESAVFEHSGVTIIPVERFDMSDYANALFLNVSHCCLDYEIQHRQCVDKSRFDLFAEHCWTTIDSHSTIEVTDAEIRHIYDRMPVLKKKAHGYKIVGIVLRSMQDFRDYPHVQLLAEYFNRLTVFDVASRKIVPVILDDEISIDEFVCTNDLDTRELIAFISQLNLLVGPDTGPMHVAGTMDIPTLWLFGPTDPNMRLVYYPNAEFVWKPCRKGKACWYDYCESLNCMWRISPWYVARRVKDILNDTTRL